MIAVLSVLVTISAFTPLDRIVAVVGEQPVLHSDVVNIITDSGYDIAEAGETTELYSEALEAIVEEKLLLEGAIRSGYYPTPEEVAGYVDTRIEEMRAGFPSEEAFLGALAESGISLQYLRSELEVTMGDQVAVDQYVRLMTRDAFTAVTTDPSSFLCSSTEAVEAAMMPRHLYWIYIPVTPSGDRLNEEYNLLVDLRQRIASGESFESLAVEWSDDISGSEGGDLGWFQEGDMVPSFEGAIARLSEGEISDPVVTPFGVHLIRLDERTDDGMVRASHILRIIPSTPQDLDAAFQRADSIARLIDDGMPFAEAAALFSADTRTAFDGGDLGTILVMGWNPSFADVLEDLEPGEVSQPVAYEGGTAVLIFSVGSGCYDGTNVDWSVYQESYLAELARSVAFQDEFSSLTDSLRSVIPVVYRLGSDED
jgi:peptidyl-prolyl cis-trans isomerase SurA